MKDDLDHVAEGSADGNYDISTANGNVEKNIMVVMSKFKGYNVRLKHLHGYFMDDRNALHVEVLYKGRLTSPNLS